MQIFTSYGMVVRSSLQSRKDCLIDQRLQVVHGLLPLCINAPDAWLKETIMRNIKYKKYKTTTKKKTKKKGDFT